jgi:hypothetical protein
MRPTLPPPARTRAAPLACYLLLLAGGLVVERDAARTTTSEPATRAPSPQAMNATSENFFRDRWRVFAPECD